MFPPHLVLKRQALLHAFPFPQWNLFRLTPYFIGTSFSHSLSRIPLRRAIDLAGTYNVAHILQPLLELDPTTPVPLAGRRKRPNPNAPSASMYHRQQQAAAASGGVDGEGQVTISRVGSKNHRKSKDGKTLEELYEQESLGFGGGPLQGQGSVIQGPSQQPRFLKLKPPVQMKIQDGESNEGGVGVVQQPLVPDASSFLPPGVEHLVSVDSNQNNGAIPPGTSESHIANLIGYENFGYVPQGVNLPRSNVVGSLKRSAEDGEAEAEGGSSKKRSKGDGFDLSPVKDLNNLGPSGGSFKAANRPKSNGNQMEGMMDLDVGSLNFNNGNQNNRNVVGGPRFSDKPVPVKPTDEGEKKMRNALVGLFAEEELGRDGNQDEDGDVEMESNERTKNQEKLNKILLDLNECVSLGGSGSDST